MVRLFTLLGLLLVSIPGKTQFSEIYSTRLGYSWFNCDLNKNIFAINGTKFLKFAPPYESPVSYDLQKEGFPDFIDVSNVNEIVLHFQNPRKVILLDSALKELIRPFYLDEIGLYDVSMISASADGGLWFYNYLNNTLTKLNKDFMPVVRTLDLDKYFQAPNTPNFITTFENKIYLNVPSNGILVLGSNGDYITAIHIQGLEDFQIDGKIIYFYRDNIIYCFNIKTLKTNKIYVPNESGIINAYFQKNQLIVLKKDGFSVYHHEINPSQDLNIN
jgi:hypothetical protein